MNFLEAVKLAKEGKQIRRPGWFKCEYIEIYNDKFIWGNGLHYHDFIPCPARILADDWEIYEESSKTYTFNEAMSFLEGRRIIK